MYDLKQLYSQYLRKQCSPAEARKFIDLFNEKESAAKLDALITATLEESDEQSYLVDQGTQLLLQKNKEAIHEYINQERSVNKQKSIRMIRRMVASVAAVLMLGFCIFLFTPSGLKINNTEVLLTDISPGYNQAILTLENGEQVNLNKNKKSILMHSGQISYDDGSLISSITSSNPLSISPKQGKLKLHTPKGGMYLIQLADGTKVWLNSFSTLIYPNTFTDGERIVELIGEGYFEVTKNPVKPFKVISGGQVVEVLGTSFNISAYPDDQQSITTLVSGKVNISSSNTLLSKQSKMLLPGMEAVIDQRGIQLQTADLDTNLGWKNGVFAFYESDIKEVLKKLSRWYDFELEIKGTMPRYFISGEIERNKKLSEVLDLLKESGLKFKMLKAGNQQKLIIIS